MMHGRVAHIIILVLLVSVLTDTSAHAQADSPDETVYIEQAMTVGGTVRSQDAAITKDEAFQMIEKRLWSPHRSVFRPFLSLGYLRGGSFAFINQQGEGNDASLDQIGLSNVAIMYQVGSRNTTLLTQHGDGNVYGSWLTGNDSYLDVNQVGDDNVYLLDFTGHGLNPDHHRAVQIGNNNQAVQVGSGPVPFDIEQRGNDMNLIIEHRSVQ